MRGTQSFVGVMSAVWRRPSLTGLEIAWRWAFGGALLGLLWWRTGADWVNRWSEYQAGFQLALRGSFLFGFDSRLLKRDVVVLLVLGVVWACVSALGRLAILRRLDAGLRGRWSTLAQLAVLRVLSLGVLLAVLVWGLVEIGDPTVIKPLQAHGEPAYVLGFAGILGLSLLLFVLWSLVSWVLQLAPVLAVARDLGAMQSLRAAVKEGPLRAKLVEINLVMGIVKIALIVLAMVFSASPLPFTSVATPTFLACWWGGVVLLYFAMSDYFHVVRVAATLSLWRTYHPEFHPEIRG